MNTESWLPLLDYSQKYKVSMSTLRRRIKAEDITFRFDDGKYYISDEPLSAHQRIHRPSPKSEGSLMGAHAASTAFEARYNASTNSTDAVAPSYESMKTWAPYTTPTPPNIRTELRASGLGATLATPSVSPKFDFNSPTASSFYSQAAVSTQKESNKKENTEEQVLTVANRLLNELKKAYTQILQEKEEQILILKEEVADLKTLVKVLEDDNVRNRR